MTLTEFLLARIAEDEALARAACIPAREGYKPNPELREWRYVPGGEVEYVQTAEMLAHKYADPIYVTLDGEGLSPSVSEGVGTHIACHDPARVLAECEAKRQVIEAAWDDHLRIEGEWGLGKSRSELEAVGDVPSAVEALAAVYSDHPDYRDEWRVSE